MTATGVATMGRWEISIPGFHPPSNNRLVGRHWSEVRRVKRACYDVVSMYCRNLAGVPAAAARRRLTLTLVMGPRQRRGDPDNYLKALLDALRAAAVIVDDGPKWLDLAPVQFERGPRAATRLVIEDIEPEPAPCRRRRKPQEPQP